MSSPPLTRVEQKKLELRRDIIDTAFEVFAEKGYHATGIADIATRLGIGHGTFYRYFENKRDIVEHVVEDLIGRIVGALAEENAPEAVDTLEDYREQTARIGIALGRIVLDDPRVPQMVLLQAPGIDPAMGQRIQDFFALAEGITAQYLERGVNLGYLRRGSRCQRHRGRHQRDDPWVGSGSHPQSRRSRSGASQRRDPSRHVRRHRAPCRSRAHLNFPTGCCGPCSEDHDR